MIVLYIFLGLMLALLIAAALMPKAYSIERTIIILRPVAEVMSKISDLNYYSEWNPWQKTDPTVKRTVTGTPATAGHRYSWVGKKVGEGQLTFLNMDSEHIHLDLEFFKPFKSKAKDNWHFQAWGENETKVTWQNSGELPWPMGRLMGPMISKGLGKQFEEGLLNLKAMCEK